MKKKQYLTIGGLALFIYLLFPEYQKFRDYRRAAADPLSARASHFIYTYSDSWYTNRLEKKYDDAKLKDLLSRCETNSDQGRFGGALNCCDALRWHIRHSKKCTIQTAIDLH